jgi:hypothetical protein
MVIALIGVLNFAVGWIDETSSNHIVMKNNKLQVSKSNENGQKVA